MYPACTDVYSESEVKSLSRVCGFFVCLFVFLLSEPPGKPITN